VFFYVRFWQIYSPIIPRNGTICNFVVNSFSEGRDEAMQKITITVKKTIAYLAKKSASVEANTACPCVGFQPKEPQTVKKLRKF
jgi:cyclic lactone autoinducer peptide